MGKKDNGRIAGGQQQSETELNQFLFRRGFLEDFCTAREFIGGVLSILRNASSKLTPRNLKSMAFGISSKIPKSNQKSITRGLTVGDFMIMDSNRKICAPVSLLVLNRAKARLTVLCNVARHLNLGRAFRSRVRSRSTDAKYRRERLSAHH
jgi:hypothetical protein